MSAASNADYDAKSARMGNEGNVRDVFMETSTAGVSHAIRWLLSNAHEFTVELSNPSSISFAHQPDWVKSTEAVGGDALPSRSQWWRQVSASSADP